MDSQTLYQIAKTFHLAGFIIAVGVTLTTFLAYNQFWKLYAVNHGQGLAAFKTFKLIQTVGMVGLMIVLVAGISMLAISNWTFIHSLWFQLKLGLIGLIFLNGFTLGRTSTLQLNAFLTKDSHIAHQENQEAKRLKNRLRTFQMIQICIYSIIILLSVFRIS